MLSVLTGCTWIRGRPVVYIDSRTYWAGAVVDAAARPTLYCQDCGDPNATIYPPGPVRYDAPPLPASPRDRIANAPAVVRFDATQARATLAGADLSSCREQEAPRGYGHAVVTYSEAGFATKVVIDDPAGLSPTAVRCVGEKLGAQTVAAFAGPATEVGVTWFIK
jgi:hypothetical protein